MCCTVAPRRFEFEDYIALAVDGEALVGDCRARDVAAQLFDTFTIFGRTTYAGVQAEALIVGQ